MIKILMQNRVLVQILFLHNSDFINIRYTNSIYE